MMSPSHRPLPALAARHAEFVGFVDRRVHDRALAEDLVHAAFEHALERADMLRDEEAVVAWFYRSLRNAIVDRHRRHAAEGRALAALATEIDERIDAVETRPPTVCRCVLRVARGLKQEYADALQGIEVDGAAVKTFAADHAISSSNAAVRIFRAREALRRGVLATCGACAEGGCVDCTCENGSQGIGRDCRGA
ncbi:MAG: sigma-70 family RNA polymerase sigma factor [Myxococcota bacterium]|nr:sigma-70 family RNA polymerase sigma factor [Myxococcota bacterium]